MSVWFVEYVTARSWATAVWPRLVRERPSAVWLFEGTSAGLRVAMASSGVAGVPIDRLEYRFAGVFDPDGMWMRLRVQYREFAEVQSAILREPALQAALAEDGALEMPLRKAIATVGYTERGTLWRLLLTIRLCGWAMRRAGQAGQPARLFALRQPWWPALAAYAAAQGVRLEAIPGPLDWRAGLHRVVSPDVRNWVRATLRRRAASSPWTGPARIGVCAAGQLHLDRPECYSDFAPWQAGLLPGRDVVALFNQAYDPLDAAKRRALQARGIDALALSPEATTDPEAPVFAGRPRLSRSPRLRGPEGAWLGRQVSEYRGLRRFWRGAFAHAGVRLFMTWAKYDAIHVAQADAVRDLGGIMAVYQRAYESHPSPETAIAADVVFGFAPSVAEMERRNGSRIGYHVSVGYLGDYRAALMRESAAAIRARLPASRVMAFTDENSKDDGRWHAGHEVMRGSYAFLLERVLDTSDFGLLLKPKIPSTLRRRLGPVADLLKRAEATGRCLLLGDGAYHSAMPPVLAGLAADVMVHGYLCAATAGVETALAGVPTLMLDQEGWLWSPLYRLGEGRVVFRDWLSLWSAWTQRAPGLGDWSPLLPELDPFRDGRGIERMSAYLGWLLEGLRAGTPRERVLADAAERYAAQWGAEHVIRMDAPMSLEALAR